MGMGKGVKPGLGHGGIICVLQTQFFFLFFFFFFEGGGGAGELAFYFKGTLENNSLFLGNKTSVRECLKRILRNKADHKKKTFLLYPFLPTYIPPTQHILWHFLEIIIQRKKMHAKYFPAYLPIPKYRVGVLQILNLKNDPLLENVVNYF